MCLPYHMNMPFYVLSYEHANMTCAVADLSESCLPGSSMFVVVIKVKSKQHLTSDNASDQ